jgi:hypothetical protein
MDAGLEERLRDRRMHMVGRDDRDRFDTVRPLGLRLGHALVVAVDAIRREAQSLAGTLGFLRCGGECPGDEDIVIVHARGEAMHGADEGAFAATHHSQAHA